MLTTITIVLLSIASVCAIILGLIYRMHRLTKKRNGWQEKLDDILSYQARLEKECNIKDVNYVRTQSDLDLKALYCAAKIKSLDAKINK